MPSFTFTIQIDTATREQAETVLWERIGPDEDYGFPYTIDLAPTGGVCPLDGGAVRIHRHADDLRSCTACGETLTPAELVKTATPETRATYLGRGNTDTRA